MPSLHDMLCFPPDNFVSHEVKRWHNVFCRAPGPSHPQSIARAITQLKTRDVFPAGSVSVSLSLSLCRPVAFRQATPILKIRGPRCSHLPTYPDC